MFRFERHLHIFLLILVVSGLSACRSQDPNPELKDPIFQDLSKLRKEYDRKLKEAETTQENNYKELAAAGADGMSLKVARKQLRDNAKKVTLYRQMATYYRIRSERRRVEGRRAYKIAFEKEEDWPKPEEYQNYLVNKRLRMANRSWSSRVPKMPNRYSSSIPED